MPLETNYMTSEFVLPWAHTLTDEGTKNLNVAILIIES